MRWALGTIALSAGLRPWLLPTLDAPATAKVGSEVSFTVSGASNPRDFVTIVPKAQNEGSYLGYVYVEKGGTLKLVMPAVAGDYELRLLGASSPYPTHSNAPISSKPFQRRSISPRRWRAARNFQVTWTGPKNARDFVGIGNATQKYGTYHYASERQPAHVPGARQRPAPIRFATSLRWMTPSSPRSR